MNVGASSNRRHSCNLPLFCQILAVDTVYPANGISSSLANQNLARRYLIFMTWLTQLVATFLTVMVVLYVHARWQWWALVKWLWSCAMIEWRWAQGPAYCAYCGLGAFDEMHSYVCFWVWSIHARARWLRGSSGVIVDDKLWNTVKRHYGLILMRSSMSSRTIHGL